MKISEPASQKIKNMGFLCALLVVTIHLRWPEYEPLPLGWFLYQSIAQGIARIAVPFFFIVSGFFLAQHFDEHGWWKRENQKRIKSLLIPFVVWSIISLITAVLIGIISDVLAHRPFGTNIFCFNADKRLRILGLDLTGSPLHFPLWYVRCLILFVLTGGVFKWMVSRFGYLWLVAAFGFLLLASHIPNENWREFFRIGYSAAGIFYFSVGIFIQLQRLKKLSNKWAIGCAAIGLLLLTAKLLCAYHGLRIGNELGKISLPFLIYAVWHCVSESKWPNWLTGCSFSIFLMHIVVFDVARVILKHLPIHGVVLFWSLYTFGTIVPILTTMGLRRFAPKLASIAFGGR